jgi:uncharacterized protein (TIGR02147 family)
MPSINLFEYNDYRAYLRAKYDEEKARKKSFSLRNFARVAGFGSSGYLIMVMNGQRNLTPKSVTAFNLAFKHSKKESAYFEHLVLYNQCDDRDSERKDRYLEQLLTFRPRHPIGSMTRDQFECFNRSYFVTIREMAALPGFREDVDWIKANLRQRVMSSEVKRALQILERLKLLERGPDGKLRHSNLTLETPLHAESLEILNYHRQTLAEAKYAILSAPYDEHDLASMTIPIPKECLPKVMELMQKCREEILDQIKKSTHDYHEVYQINMQVFPLTKTGQIESNRIKTKQGRVGMA